MKQFCKSNVEEGWLDLIEAFPIIFSEPSNFLKEHIKLYPQYFPKIKDVVNLRYGVEVEGTGWKKIIWEFCEEVTKLSQKARDNGHEAYFKPCILKEKFGELNNQGYWDGKECDLYFKEYIKFQTDLQNNSREICELTGNPGELMVKEGWYKTLSEEKAKELGFKKVYDATNEE